MNNTEKKDLNPDQAAAHEFLTELRTRITTQSLPYQHGVETRALESLWEIFSQAREIIKKNPGCMRFADAIVPVLNVKIRPVTAKWHKAYVEGRLNSRDGANEFREDLAKVQMQLREFIPVLREMAYGTGGVEAQVPPVMSEEELNKHFEPLPFGIQDSPLYPKSEVEGEKEPGRVKQINESEFNEVQRRRKFVRSKAKEGNNAAGLSFSGGGIRSASFCLGVAQVLAERDLLKDIDFLSTVSGGGYVGSFISRRLGVEEAKMHEIASPDGPDTEAISYLRHHAQYLMGFKLDDRWGMVTSTLGGMILNWTSPAMFIALLSIFAIETKAVRPAWPEIMTFWGCLSLLALILYGILLRFSKPEAKAGAKVLSVTVALLAASILGWLITVGYEFAKETIVTRNFWTVSGIVGLLVASGPTLIRFMPILKTPEVRKMVLKVLLALAGLIIPILAVALLYTFYYLGTLSPAGFTQLCMIAGVLIFVSVLVLNVNVTAPHKLYRDRLDKTFVQFDEKASDDFPLESLNSKDTVAPYHLINTTVNLPSSDSPSLRERRCDFFLFSKHWSGSPSTGYYRTTKWQTNQDPVDLSTTMAISGAAVSSYMGLVSMPSLTALLTFLNVRLGFWILSPFPKRWWARGGWPGFWCLTKEMIGCGMSEKSDWLNLSDGGHIENMGAYELLRRRCKFVICVDGEADPDFTYIGLITMVRHAQIDLGTRIEINMSDIKPDPKTGYSATHSLLCRIHYPATETLPAATGLFLYLKLSVTGNESELIKRYRIIHPEFPHQSTLDQFFDQEQFEAYRQLGVHIAKGLFASAVTGGATEPLTLDDWFRSLAKNLLLPERA